MPQLFSLCFERLEDPSCNLKFGTRYYSFIALILYSELPIKMKGGDNIDMLKKGLKIYLFSIFYDQGNIVINEGFMI